VVDVKPEVCPRQTAAERPVGADRDGVKLPSDG